MSTMLVPAEKIRELAREGRLAMRVHASFGQTGAGEHTRASAEERVSEVSCPLLRDYADEARKVQTGVWTKQQVWAGTRAAAALGLYSDGNLFWGGGMATYRLVEPDEGLLPEETGLDSGNLAYQRALLAGRA